MALCPQTPMSHEQLWLDFYDLHLFPLLKTGVFSDRQTAHDDFHRNSALLLLSKETKEAHWSLAIYEFLLFDIF